MEKLFETRFIKSHFRWSSVIFPWSRFNKLRCRSLCILSAFLALVLGIFYFYSLYHHQLSCMKLKHPSSYGNDRTATPDDYIGSILSMVGFHKLLATDVEHYLTSSEILPDFEFFWNEDVCKVDYKILIVAVVFSKPSNFKERQAIRSTWGSQFKNEPTLKLVFLIGQSDHVTYKRLVQEYEEHSDIVLFSFTESYSNLVYKSIAMLQWTKEFCSEAKYLLKIDDDVLLYTNNLLTALDSLKNEENFIFGCLLPYNFPILDENDKWDVHNTYPFQRYPPYMRGSIYVISSDLVGRLHEVAVHRPQFHLEDVYITGVCAFVARANHIGYCGCISGYKTYMARLMVRPYPPLTIYNVNYESMLKYWQTKREV